MSEKNGKVCCNCRHCIRIKTDNVHVECRCDINNAYLGYISVMTKWCRRWAKEKKDW